MRVSSLEIPQIQSYRLITFSELSQQYHLYDVVIISDDQRDIAMVWNIL